MKRLWETGRETMGYSGLLPKTYILSQNVLLFDRPAHRGRRGKKPQFEQKSVRFGKMWDFALQRKFGDSGFPKTHSFPASFGRRRSSNFTYRARDRRFWGENRNLRDLSESPSAGTHATEKTAQSRSLAERPRNKNTSQHTCCFWRGPCRGRARHDPSGARAALERRPNGARAARERRVSGAREAPTRSYERPWTMISDDVGNNTHDGGGDDTDDRCWTVEDGER